MKEFTFETTVQGYPDVVVTFDYYAAQNETRTDPGYPEEIDISSIVMGGIDISDMVSQVAFDDLCDRCLDHVVDYFAGIEAEKADLEFERRKVK